MFEYIIVQGEGGRVEIVALRDPFHLGVVFLQQTVGYLPGLLQVKVHCCRDVRLESLPFDAFSQGGTRKDLHFPALVELGFVEGGC